MMFCNMHHPLLLGGLVEMSVLEDAIRLAAIYSVFALVRPHATMVKLRLMHSFKLNLST